MSESTMGSPESVDELMLKKLFDQCDDEFRTGQVKSVDLIAAIQVRAKKLRYCACLTYSPVVMVELLGHNL